ncbi:DoxX family protein [Dyadobacter crusticola]|uniref:DoxX family protein n=1 Tax=Dyadobacter crusticola TaxID=292407 RepID=UPI0004E27B0F|nr:DoxX family protein [Dyadobacter crusticola]
MTGKQPISKTINLFLWAAQVQLAATLVWASFMKLFKPAGELAQMWPWAADHPGLVKFTGTVDLLAAAGLIFPMLLGIWPQLTRYAAYGVMALMAAAVVFHLSRSEGSGIAFNLVVALIAWFIARGRK